MEIDLHWLRMFSYTQIIEVLLGSLGYLVFKSLRVHSLAKSCLLIGIATSLTHPILWFCITPICRELEVNQILYWISGESYVVFMESYWYKVCKIPNYFYFSLVLNLASYLSFFILV